MQALVISYVSLVHEPLCRHSAVYCRVRSRCVLVDIAQMSSSPWSTLALTMRTSSTGLSSAATFTRPILCTEERISIVSQTSWIAPFGHVPIFIPLLTLPKIVCLPSNHGVGAKVIKNWDPAEPKQVSVLSQTLCCFCHIPFVFGPLLAMLKMPAPVCFKSERISSSNFSP